MTVVVYSKPDCSLCDKADAILARLAREFPMDVRHVDITTDPELWARYRFRIPVLVAGGREIASGIVTTPALRDALRRIGSA
jgi:glutaredoxin